jgi:N-acetylmuramoyl-L-alanine amidase
MLRSAPHARFLPAARCGISAILFAVRHPLLTFILSLALIFWLSPPRATAWQEQSPTPAQAPAPPQNPMPPPLHLGPTIVINPAHGGTDNGARGQSGQVEKDVILIFARMLRSEFERQGYRVVMTRNDDSNPSYEDRAAIANGYRDSILISMHVSSTGKVGTARAYSYQFAAPLAAASISGGAGSALPSVTPTAATRVSSLVLWDQAQQPFVEASHRLADVLQVQLAQRFGGSPAVSTRIAVRELRSVAAPAVAVEVSSVSVGDPNTLLVMGAPLAASIVRGLQVLRPLGSSPGNSSAPAGTR